MNNKTFFIDLLFDDTLSLANSGLNIYLSNQKEFLEYQNLKGYLPLTELSNEIEFEINDVEL
jgi:hypothetical protein